MYPDNGIWLPVFGIFKVHTDIDACDYTQGLCRHRKRVCAESWLWEKNHLPQRGLKPASVLCLLAFELQRQPTELFPTPGVCSPPLPPTPSFSQVLPRTIRRCESWRWRKELRSWWWGPRSMMSCPSRRPQNRRWRKPPRPPPPKNRCHNKRSVMVRS